jgi:hypothetical protein
MLKRLVLSTLAGAIVVGGSVVGTGVAGASTALSTTTTTTAKCDTHAWPAAAEGRPPAAKVGMTGVALWHDADGWHLRVSEAGPDRAVFTGVVSTDGLLVSVRRHLEGGDITLSPGPHSVVYRFTNYGGVDGIDFGALCGSTIRVTAFMNGRPVPVSHVVIGSGDTHPASQPIVIHRAA